MALLDLMYDTVAPESKVISRGWVLYFTNKIWLGIHANLFKVGVIRLLVLLLKIKDLDKTGVLSASQSDSVESWSWAASLSSQPGCKE